MPRDRCLPEADLQHHDEGLRRHQAWQKHLVAVHVALSGVAGLLTVPELPALVPVVRAHGLWGGRGELRGYFRETLKAAYPGVVDTRVLVEGAARHFGRTFDSVVERDRFRRIHVASTLRKLVACGDVERVHDPVAAPRSLGVGRWRVEAPSLEDLARLERLAQLAQGPALMPVQES